MNKFEELPKEVQERVQARNEFSSELAGAEDAARKADFLTQMLKDDFTDEIPTKENQWVWVYNRERICMMVDVIRDYTFMVQEELTRIEDQLIEKNTEDGWGGIKRCLILSMKLWKHWSRYQRKMVIIWN